MVRITAPEVKEIIDTDFPDHRIEVFIQGASKLIDNKLVGQGLDDATLQEIERWLAAHYIAVTSDRQAIQEIAGPVEQRFSDIFGQFLLATTWGQTAISLDPTGILQDIADGRRSIKLIAIPE